MGGKLTSASQKGEINDIKEKVSKSSFEMIAVIGKGGFGKVWKAFSFKDKTFYAIKEMSKAKIIDHETEDKVKNERDLLCRINHPFIINMQYAFQDTENLYIVMDLLTGGDLRYHLLDHKTFNEEQTKFFMGCLILGLEYLHTNNVIHRDIKPENLVLDRNGYVKITDFGIAKIARKENKKDSSGTLGYAAPEILSSQNYTFAVDYFALGVISYECMLGVRPYSGKDKKEIKELIIHKQACIKSSEIPNGWSIESADFINRLLQRKPNLRLGYRGSAEIKEHSWFKYFPWKDLYLGKMTSHFIPSSNDNYDINHCRKKEHIGLDILVKYEEIKKSSTYHTVFKSFAYYNRWFHENQCHSENNPVTPAALKDFQNPHLIYHQKNEDGGNDNDASILNRNILKKISPEDDYLVVKKKQSKQRNSSVYQMYSGLVVNNNSHCRNNSNNLNCSRGTNNSSFRNYDINGSYISKNNTSYKVNNYNF